MALGTDMAKHAMQIKEVVNHGREWKEMGESQPADKQKALDNKIFLLETVLHASDISNPCKPRPIMMDWTKCVLEEFWAQGDEEQRLKLEVSPLCDRASGMTAVPKGQIGFISFV